MANTESLYFNTKPGYHDHVLRQFDNDWDTYLKSPRMWLTWYHPNYSSSTVAGDPVYKTRKREKSLNGVPLAISATVADGEVYETGHVLSTEEYQVFIDTLYGRGLKGRWIGGPRFSIKDRVKREPIRLHLAKEWTNPAFLQPPITQNTGAGFAAPLPSRDFIDTGGLFSLNRDSGPTAISGLISRAYEEVQGARNSSRPDTPVLNTINSIVELRDITRMLKLAGDTFVSQGASAYLSYEFGWKPFLSDLRKLYSLQQSIERRLKAMIKNRGKPVRRRRFLYNIEGRLETSSQTWITDPSSRTIGPKAGEFKSDGKWSASAMYHSYIRYDMPIVSIETMPLKYKQVFSGLSLDGNVLWNAIPWTWLVDWFTNIGDMVENTFATKLVDTQTIEEWVTIQLKCTSKYRVPAIFGSNFGSEGSSAGTATTSRDLDVFWRGIPPLVTPLAVRNPLEFTNTQQAILAALVASRTRFR